MSNAMSIVLGPLLLALAGCQPTNTHVELGWRAEDFFDDPKVVRLCDAILADDLSAMQDAVDAGADINAVGKHGMTPLLWSFPDHKLERFRWLLERGADPNVCVTKNLSRGLRSIDRGKSVTHLAIETRWPEYYQLVLDNGGNPNLRCEGQREPLLHVAFGPTTPNKKERIVALLDAGADINAKGSSDTTVAMSAAAVAYFDIALLLVERGADTSIYQERHNRQLVHFVIRKEATLDRYSDSNKQAYRALVKKLKLLGVDFQTARDDIARWKSWTGSIADKKRLREQEMALRHAREAKQHQKLELAKP